ncbi:mechanosensitive ion channel family protein [Geomicrobium sp. JCM 19055]|uniref:mechanosensitive ion channel family protein n=1 Tax=Geomicrobium sp. JCM 19055 TaxID=1460649 RepID=UPI00045ED162|nr:mechanosensitive ion channel family protein [Geomicrobium sp. JCM 19055]GAJ97349.1 potassium efflux system KefA protein [Geomicrobium sp. JCM 19055]
MFDFDFQAIMSAAIPVLIEVVLIIVGYLIVRAVGASVITRIFKTVSEKRNIHPGRIKTLKNLVHSIFTYVLLFVFVLVFLGAFGVEIMPILAGAGVVGLAVAFGAQGLVSDIVTGFFLLIEKQIDAEDYVTVAGLDGIVEEVGLRTTRIRGFDGTLHFIPNRDITSVSNHSRGNMEAFIDIGISFNENINEAITVLQKATKELYEQDENIVEEPYVLGVSSFDEYDMKIRILTYTTNMNQWAVERKLRQVCKEALEEADIQIPVPKQVYVEEKQS